MRVFKPFLIITMLLIPGALFAQKADTLDINEAIRLGSKIIFRFKLPEIIRLLLPIITHLEMPDFCLR